mmetsp:Transcript_23517/g.23190  ORF Transcript_23517/g.23190 Transcript_23517/m.23190 type:complete len:123 (-) Transcript_23517:439-807(-)|eukprot:CAMPEP_0170553830 /NCGR_PEP_ID=MMETSP0211-20121228/11650_1 /TAXON_ID=311385 /ORGANISM="Pseudokeronopsis sp., Strain OXSARD2" /LENGTH=122 /DNA_ID=CAMNT_0010862415 /DNA_START=866 /DNA_END=1234 /DNA_ORIENTATION=-
MNPEESFIMEEKREPRKVCRSVSSKRERSSRRSRLKSQNSAYMKTLLDRVKRVMKQSKSEEQCMKKNRIKKLQDEMKKRQGSRLENLKSEMKQCLIQQRTLQKDFLPKALDHARKESLEQHN